MNKDSHGWGREERKYIKKHRRRRNFTTNIKVNMLGIFVVKENK